MANNEAEFFAVATTGRKGLQEMADKMQVEIMQIAAESVAKAGSTWMQRAVVSISNNDKLVDVLKTKTGLFSIYKALAKSATMGLQIGGQFPQAYLTPMGATAELIVSAEGYKHTAIHGPGAVLSNCEFRRVYDGEQFSIDFSRAEVRHNYDGKAERGKLIGVYGIITRSDGATAVDYMTRTEALQIRDGHSAAWKAGRPTPWKTDEDAMIEKTAAKKFLRKYAAEAEGLAMLFGQDGDEAEEYTPPARDVSERMGAHLDRKAERVASAEPAMKQAEPAEEAEPEADPEPAASTKPAEIF